ncbi:diguanylate cyclase (GGDEF) domain-containing protein [Balnearium lithotrophicum]|uniref:diguanylate cyclase n=2 Tax=Balnearium lithotrophicum TaxID=223788 RepID=A0A521BVS0_9BACT|nr:diguanylate cyclase (GGDEF) domain-containing protein [Balnearium lithotrophicum]
MADIFLPIDVKKTLLLIDFGLVLPAGILLFLLTYRIKNVNILELLFSILIIFVGLVNIIQCYFLPEGSRQWLFFGISLIILFSYAFQRFKYAIFSSLSLSLFYILMADLFIRLDKNTLLANILFLTVENLISVFCSYLKERTFIRDILLSVFTSQSNNELKILSYIDGLTGIPNRRFFEEQFEREWKRAMRTKRPISLLMIDIDFFKNFNDTLGHLEGDWVLREVARIISENLRKDMDIVARYGGEEFVVVLPETDAKEAKEVAERIRKAIESRCIEHPSSKVSKCVTVSIGIATITPEENQSKEILIKRADEALYEAKRKGRNRVEVFAKSES